MIVLYTAHGCHGCRNAKKWLREHGIEFIEKDIHRALQNPKEFKYLLQRTENGTEDIISTRSKAFLESGLNINKLSLEELSSFVREHPSVLKRPIMINERNLVVGYDSEEITALLPAKLRLIANNECNEKCEHYETCGKFHDDNFYE